MKKLRKIFYFNVVLFTLAGCAVNMSGESKIDSSKNSSVSELTKEDATGTDNSISTNALQESTANINLDNTVSKHRELNIGDKRDKETLSQYSSEQIEYARVWSQLGPNQEIDELNVRHIPAGELINPDDDTSASYPEDVIQLAGSRLVDGSVTYSGNGDGTINVYNVPLRWNGGIRRTDLDEGVMRKQTEDIIKNAELAYVNTGEDEKIIKLIKALNIHY
ncbi:hypothetical protein SFC65_19620 [Priestia filamentosa]|uniref:hypothetical protein n=1 Tax=Priestia filamentosa TaxID=1402861 RepID=UPI0039825840